MRHPRACRKREEPHRHDGKDPGLQGANDERCRNDRFGGARQPEQERRAVFRLVERFDIEPFPDFSAK